MAMPRSSFRQLIRRHTLPHSGGLRPAESTLGNCQAMNGFRVRWPSHAPGLGPLWLLVLSQGRCNPLSSDARTLRRVLSPRGYFPLPGVYWTLTNESLHRAGCTAGRARGSSPQGGGAPSSEGGVPPELHNAFSPHRGAVQTNDQKTPAEFSTGV